MNFNNNMSCASHFLRECNLAFQHFLCTSHLDYALTALNARILNSSNNLKFRRKLGFLQNYCIRTRLTWWDKKALYLEQKLTCPDERGTLCAINFSRQTLEGAEMHELLGQLNVCTCLPEYPPPEIEAWNVFIHTINQKLTVSGAR
ncbi:protein THEM6-like [Babylonia areolata]|uniref:protein THEM6-like n=1 Tax=Babylonia areolata TaxID=304850 RepID=UPI003FD1D8DD